MIVNNPKDNSMVDWVNQVKYNILVANDLDKKTIDYIDPWVETL